MLGTLSASGAVMAQQAVYDAVPVPLPGNVPSIGFEATSTAEFGDQVTLAPGGRRLSQVVVTMSSWACESGSWNAGTCATTPGATFTHPLTLNIYSVKTVAGMPATDQLLATKTLAVAMPYRPSANANCSGGRWQDVNGACFNGLAFNVAIDMKDLGAVLPDDIIWGIAYNTTHRGYQPIGGAGGPYDSLNVGLSAAATVGTDVDPDSAFANSTWAGFYCDGGANGTGSFRFDEGCWGGYVPAARIAVYGLPANGNQCKKNGWMNLSRADGSLFKNQGDCVSYTKNGK
jgi:hypothetical protein